MEADISDKQLQETLAKRFKELPKIVQEAITSTDLQQRLRALADTQKLHIDQWELLENEVMLTLLGFQDPEDLAENFKKTLNVSEEVSRVLAENVSDLIFVPIRAELEKSLAAPAESAMQQALPQKTLAEQRAPQAAPAAETVVPGTPPPPQPTERAVRAPISASYAAGQASHERKVVEGDPYREQLA